MRKRVLLFSLFVAGFLGLWGCHGNDFPAGTWRPDESRWVFTFEPDGRISKVVHHGGMEFEVAEGGLVEQWRGGIEAVYGLGPCEAQYDPKTRELSVKIVVEHFIIEFPNGTMEGNFHDYLTGPVSGDGTTWSAAWVSLGEIIGGGSSDPNTVVPKRLTFTKVTNDSKTD
jgi:hypothetical protein